MSNYIIINKKDVLTDADFFPFSDCTNKRARTSFTIQQLDKLEELFERRPYLSVIERQKYCEELQLTDTQVRIWFQNRRTKERKLRKTQTQIAADFHHSYYHPIYPKPVTPLYPYSGNCQDILSSSAMNLVGNGLSVNSADPASNITTSKNSHQTDTVHYVHYCLSADRCQAKAFSDSVNHRERNQCFQVEEQRNSSPRETLDDENRMLSAFTKVDKEPEPQTVIKTDNQLRSIDESTDPYNPLKCLQNYRYYDGRYVYHPSK